MFGRMMSQKKADVTPGALGGMLGEVSCNSPGALRSNRSKKSNRGNASSPYRRSNRIITKLTSTTSLATSAFENDGDALLTPGRDSSTMFVADKHVGIRKSSGPRKRTCLSPCAPLLAAFPTCFYLVLLCRHLFPRAIVSFLSLSLPLSRALACSLARSLTHRHLVPHRRSHAEERGPYGNSRERHQSLSPGCLEWYARRRCHLRRRRHPGRAGH